MSIHELYTIALQGSTSSGFASELTDICMIQLGDLTQLTSDADQTTGVYVIPFSNAFGINVYRYLRLYITIAGTIATGINFTAWITKD